MATPLNQQVNNIFRDMRKKADTLTAVIVLETDAKLKEQSPVDSGRFRASWRVSEGEIDESVNAEANTTPQNYNEEITAGKDYYLTNSLPYAQRLADGHSQQAPSGWIELIAMGIEQRINQVAEDLNRGGQRQGDLG